MLAATAAVAVVVNDGSVVMWRLWWCAWSRTTTAAESHLFSDSASLFLFLFVLVSLGYGGFVW
ncbi:hypothetical protein A2U01_0056016 [Trifolium medium]|uniref:Uncharacterized protein n=1 Tax=Trifolium medium TaxID=97028 RepID=A0A392RGS8_9FABA|nr:hypothetical protein [Trifolium medium]